MPHAIVAVTSTVGATGLVSICHNFPHVRSLSTLAVEADHRGALRHCRLARRLVATLQRRPDPAHPGNPPKSQGADPRVVAHAMGTDSELGEGHVRRGEDD